MDLLGRERLNYVALAVGIPILTASLIGPVFQIVAVENLGMSPNQIGLAIGLGALSIPVQLRAARSPLRKAQSRLRLFVLVMAVLCAVMAWLVQVPMSASVVIAAAIVASVTAELAISVLWATSWQPLLSERVSPSFRQRLNAQARAVGGLILIGIVVIIGRLGVNGRTAVLLTIGLLGCLLVMAVVGLGGVDRTSMPGGASDIELASQYSLRQTLFDAEFAPLYLAIALSALPAWPFFIAYSAEAFWPTANLGWVAAAVTAGPLAVAALWQPTETFLLRRAKIGALVGLISAGVIIAISRPVSGTAAAIATLAAITAAMAAGTVIRMSLLEMAHQRSQADTSVAVLTILDVVVSTAGQMGFFAAGFLISASVGSTSAADPYQASLLVLSLALFVLLTRLDRPSATVG